MLASNVGIGSRRLISLVLCCGAILPCAAFLPGCGAKVDENTVDPAENIRQLALSYVQYSAQNRGVGPKDKEKLKEFMIKRNGMNEADAEARFISPRDNEEYVIRWGLRPQGSGPIGPDPPKSPIIIYEKTGDGRTHITADGKMAVITMSEEELASALGPQK